MTDTEPIQIQYYEQIKQFKKYNKDKLSLLTDKDKELHVQPFIELVNSLVLSGDKYYTYISLGSRPYSLSDTTKCIAQQLFPTIFPNTIIPKDAKVLYIVIDIEHSVTNEVINTHFTKLNKNHTIGLLNIKYFNMYWYDDYKPLLDSFKLLLEYNRQMVGMTILTNFVKYRSFDSPEFNNLISMFYPDSKLIKIYHKFSIQDHYSCIENSRAIYLEWIGYFTFNKINEFQPNSIGDTK